jgi:hypothetical protein
MFLTLEHGFEVMDDLCVFVDSVQARYLDHPTDVRAPQTVVHHPLGERIPLCRRASINGNAILCELIFVGFEIVKDLARDLCQIVAFQHIIVFEEDLAQTRLADRIVLQIELIEAVERLIRVHVQCIDRQVVWLQIQRLKHLCQCQSFVVAHDHCVRRTRLQSVLYEPQQMLNTHREDESNQHTDQHRSRGGAMG